MEKNADSIRAAGHRYVVKARHEGLDQVTIVAGDIVRELQLTYRVPSVCSALTSKRFLEENHLTLEKLEGPPSGISTTTKYTYKLEGEEPQPSSEAKKDWTSLWALRGIMKGKYDDEGGGEAHLKAERAAWVDKVEEYYNNQ